MKHKSSRRDFLRCTAASLGATASVRAEGRDQVALSVPDAASGPAKWAAQELQNALTARGVSVLRTAGPGAQPQIAIAADLLRTAGAAERIEIAPAPGRLSVTAGDDRGLIYALLDLADQVRLSPDPIVALRGRKHETEQPANRVRSVTRLFVSEVEDKPWFYDRDMWPAYFTMLAESRFNRFSLALSLGYDFLRDVTDAYFLFPYPFLLSPAGYKVRARGLADAERDRNLETLRYIGNQCAAHGLDFQLGLWMHGYEWANSPKANYTIEGLDKDTHGPYCRDALAMLLKAVPSVRGVTFRIHGESGVAEGSYDFWATVFDGVKRSGRKVEIDLHAKGIDSQMIDTALATGMPVKVSPKFWAEHLGLPYHQAEIREQERPRQGRADQGMFALSGGSRSFLRYGYGDLLREDRRYGVLHRIWPGTQRLLAWGDPVFAAAYSRAFQFCGSVGVELMEPLSFKGRRGSGVAGGRNGYADASLKPRWDWEKFGDYYRLWGRMLYNPATDPDVWRRDFKHRFQAAAAPVEAALAIASRILPTLTTAHLPSAANNNYWPEMYTNQPIVDARKNSYSDTPAPKVFGNTSPLDPQLFSTCNAFADELLAGERSGRYSPIEVAQWIEFFADAAETRIVQAERMSGGIGNPDFRRVAADVHIQAGLGHFFGAKLRAAVLYRIHEKTGDRAALGEALKAYKLARENWADLANRAKGVYASDVTVGELTWLRGHWLDRLPAIDDDIADMAKLLDPAAATPPAPQVKAAIAEALGHPQRAAMPCTHTAPAEFHPRQPLELELQAAAASQVASARLYYRHVNQGERFQSADMQSGGSGWRAAISAAYTDSPYPLEYYFEVKQGPDQIGLVPGFQAGLVSQPYFVVRQAGAKA
jgi:hypothetical protein